MSDDLRARIAKALQGEADDGFTWEDWLPLADAVIRELQLQPERTYDPIYDKTSTRYVTCCITEGETA